MKEPSPSDITILLKATYSGDEASFDRLVGLVYDELYLLARRVLGG